MINKKMHGLGTQKSIIREIAGYGAQRRAEIGAENVLDFSIGNPNVPAPDAVRQAIQDIIDNESPVAYNSYTAGNGAPETRKAVADNLNKRFGTDYSADDVFMTCGAAASLNISLQAMVESDKNEVIVVVPFFPEYKPFIEARGAKMVVVESLDSLQLDLEKIEKAINKNTKAIIINTPNNPSGVVYTEEGIKGLAEVLNKKQKEFGNEIYLISDEPYRELIFEGVEVPFIPNYYDNTIVCYSWSKSLSLPGERIGYILVPPTVTDNKDFYAAVAGSARVLGFVCAPSLMQKVVTKCVDVAPDLTVYENNRNLLYDNLTKLGYKMAKPDGAFYAFIEAPNGDVDKFCEEAKKHEMLLVPAAGFGSPTYVRLSYCVETEKIEKAIKVFEKLI